MTITKVTRISTSEKPPSLANECLAIGAVSVAILVDAHRGAAARRQGHAAHADEAASRPEIEAERRSGAEGRPAVRSERDARIGRSGCADALGAGLRPQHRAADFHGPAAGPVRTGAVDLHGGVALD